MSATNGSYGIPDEVIQTMRRRLKLHACTQHHSRRSFDRFVLALVFARLADPRKLKLSCRDCGERLYP